MSYSPNVANVLENAPRNAQYISPSIQKEILYIFARRHELQYVKRMIFLIFFILMKLEMNKKENKWK